MPTPLNLYSKSAVDTLLAGKLDNPVGPAGITFNDSTVQTTAAVAGANFGDVFGISIVKDCTYGTGWTITGAPVNPYIINVGSVSVSNFDESVVETITTLSSTSPWIFTTSTAFGATDYVYIVAFGQKSTNPVNYP